MKNYGDHHAHHPGFGRLYGAGEWEPGDYGPPWGAPGDGPPRRDRRGGEGPFRGGRRRRGDIRPTLLRELLEGPAHGYELIRRLEERSAGIWRPSAGSVYPTLQMLEEQGAVRGRDEDGKRIYELTDEGRSEAEAAGAGPFGSEAAAPHHQLRRAVQMLMVASRQVAAAGDTGQVERATAIVTEARQAIYRILAGDDQ